MPPSFVLGGKPNNVQFGSCSRWDSHHAVILANYNVQRLIPLVSPSNHIPRELGRSSSLWVSKGVGSPSVHNRFRNRTTSTSSDIHRSYVSELTFRPLPYGVWTFLPDIYRADHALTSKQAKLYCRIGTKTNF